MFQIKAKLLYNKRVKGNYFHCILNAPNIAKKAHSGQFVNIRSTDTCEPLLRRPFSIHRVNGLGVEILYEVVGSGTEILSQKKAGQYLDVIGPLGDGFDYRTPGHQDTRTPVLVAGGMGVAPLLFLADEMVAETKGHKDARKPLVLIGAKKRQEILCEKEFKELTCRVRISTDDGSRGFKGKVTDLLKNFLLTNSRTHELTTIYACGPKPMLKGIAALSKEHNIPTQISLQEHMACGIGACFGCVINTKDGYKRVCKDGPVFDANQIIWGKD